MRNLKKILALVLALVMSLSLMAVASADDELNLGDVSETYAESVDVLTGLKVFMGNKGEFLPKDNITRAEVAAIIYRIVTGDVADAQKGIYADYNKFSDVTSDAWYAGYVNYCANAEYVKGVGYDANGKAMFKPQQNVTGYEALAMILRAIGYDRNNEFTGPSWQIQTAATARNRGILKNIAEGTLGGAATREAVAEILCQTILVPVADYSLAFGYRTTDANGKDNETLAYKTFKMEKIDGVVMANEQASLTAATPLPAGQTTLGERTLNVASTLDDIGESRYVYVVPAAGSTRYNLVCSKVYDTGLNNVYDSGEPVSAVGNSTGSENGITSIAGAQHFINYDQAEQYEAKIRIEYVIRLRMSEYDAMVLYNTNGTADNSALYPIEPDGTVDVAKKIKRPDSIANNNWNTTITSNGYVMEGVNYDHTYEYRKVINAFTKLTQTDYEYIRTIFAAADRNNNVTGNYILGEVYVGTTSLGNSFVTIDQNGKLTVVSGTRDVSDTMKWENFVAEYLDVKENKAQITKNERGNRLKIVDNDNNGVADYILQTIYTVGIINANGGLDIANVKMPDGDSVNEVTASTKVINDGEGELATGNVVIYAKIDGNARAQLAASETGKINTVNRANKTATAVDSTEAWNESWVHTHSGNLQSYVSNLVTNTTYTLYFDLYGNLAAFTEGDNGQFVLITDGWYNNTISGPEYAVQTWVDGHLQTTNVTENGSLFVGPWNNNSNNTWGCLKTGFGKQDANGFGSINYGGSRVHTIVANLENGVLTPVDKIYRYSTRYDVIDMNNNVVPGRDNLTSTGTPYETNYAQGTAYQTQVRDGNDNLVSNAEVRALTTTTYYYVYKNIGNSPITGQNNNVVVRTYTGFNNIPSIDRTYIEDVYVVGQRATGVSGLYYTANVVVVELNDKYTGHMTDSEQVFVPDFAEVSSNLTIENVRMIRGTGVEETVKVDMRQSNLDWYDEAGNLVRADSIRDRRPGLFYMDLIDGSNDTYAIKRMTANDIRANNYMAGYVEKSSSVVGDNYVQVQMMVRPANVNPLSYWTTFTGADAWANRPLFVNETIASDILPLQSKSVVNDNLYTLSYSSSVATLTKADKAVVLAQSRGDAINNTQIHSLNERWARDVDRGNYWTNVNRNEVLVRYDAAGNVIWAVSFNEGTDTSINYAQTVWYNCLPAQNYDIQSKVKFFGVADNDAAKDRADAANVITVDYKDALASGKIIDLDGIAATISSYALFEGNTTSVAPNATTSVTSTNWNRMSAKEEDDRRAISTGKEYRLDVTTNTGKIETYYLIQRGASTNNVLNNDTDSTDTSLRSPYFLKVGGSSGSGSSLVTWTDGLTKPGLPGAPADPAVLSIDNYLKSFVVNDYRSTVTFDIWQNVAPNATLGAPDFTVRGELNERGQVVALSVTSGSILLDRIDTSVIAAMRVTVTSESGVAKRYFKNFTNGTTNDPSADATLTLTGSNFTAKFLGASLSSGDKVATGDKIVLSAANAGTFSYRVGTGAWQTIATVEANGEIEWTVPGTCEIKFEESATVTVTPDANSGVDVKDKTTSEDGKTVTFTIEVPEGKIPTSTNPNVSFVKSNASASAGKAAWTMVVSNVDSFVNVDVDTNEATEDALGGAAVSFSNGVKTITLPEGTDVNLAASYDVTKGNVVIDLNGNTIKAASSNAGLQVSGAGKLTIKNGTVKSETGAVLGGNTVEVHGGTLVVESDATIESGNSCYAIAVYSLDSNADMTIKGQITGTYGLTVNGNVGDANHPETATLLLDGAKIKTNGIGLYLAGKAVTSIENNTVIDAAATESDDSAIEIRAGELTIDSTSEIKYAGNTKFDGALNTNGSQIKGACLAIGQHSTNLPIKVRVNGAKLTNGVPVAMVNTFESAEDVLYDVVITGDVNENVVKNLTKTTGFTLNGKTIAPQTPDEGESDISAPTSLW